MSRPSSRPIKRLLIANRGEIATRILSSARELDIETYTLYTTDDTTHTLGSAHPVKLNSPASYLNITELIEVAKKHQIDAVHPGYGFLSESAEFSRRMWEEAGVFVVGPGWEVLERTGDKLAAKALAEECGIPVLPASSRPTDNLEDVRQFSQAIGYPIIIKAVDGGGGRGIRIVHQESDLEDKLKRAIRESPAGKVFLEKAAIDNFRHIEVQIIGDGQGTVTHLWERECSIQRRFQKVVEFAPSSIKDRALVADVINSALKMARKVNYSSLGTFEFLVRESPPEYFFLEVNPRLQVEHTITESICSLDIVQIQLKLASGTPIAELIKHPSDPRIPPPLCSIQLRVTAEDPSRDWSLSVGKISSVVFPSGNGVRVDTHMITTVPTVVKTDFDSLLAKVIVTAASWTDAVAKANRALADSKVDGVKTNLDALRGILESRDFSTQCCDTQWLEKSLSFVLGSGQKISARLSNNALLQGAGKSASAAISSTSTSTMFRKGDAWSMTLLRDGENQVASNAASEGHLQITKVLRNEFPQSLAASVLYTSPRGDSVPYTMSMTTTSASAGAMASTSRHRRGDSNNSNHVVVPFPGQLMEILIDVGDLVTKGDVLAVVRQMKMELELRASRGGTVAWVFECEEGEEVGEGVLLCELESSKL